MSNTTVTIELKLEIYARLESKAMGFATSPEDVIIRLLDQVDALAKPSSASSSTSRRQKERKRKVYPKRKSKWAREPIKKFFEESDAAPLHVGSITDHVGSKVDPEVLDCTILGSRKGTNLKRKFIWQNQVAFELYNMKLDGIVRRSPRRGYWELVS